jgi:hypothetical protein
LIFYLKAENIFYGDGGHKNPRLCRVNQAFEPFYKVGTGIGCFRLSASRQAEGKADMHTAIKERAQGQKCWLKNKC